MFFKQFRTLSLQKNITLILKSRIKNFQSGKVNSIGVIFDYDSYYNYDFFRNLIKDLGVKDNKVRFIAKVDLEKNKPNSWDSFFSLDNFDWLGRPKSVDIDDFVEQPFDVLISYYKPNQLELNLVTARSKANFKIGISNEDSRLHDLTIDVEPANTEVFKIELIKYLTQLNRL
ncbi:hypothetical protein N9K49_02785 [Flavobacteriaceae bacterium]|nr:hypothetical protein [Flavobacteriaceae bacterium]MDC1266005.1 hypothetical protein [Flavobacteriaceae bacterium]